MTVISRTYKGVRDWSVKAKRVGDNVVVTVKVGRMVHSRVNLSATTWPINRYDQQQVVTTALADAIDLAWEDWDNDELDRIPGEIVRAMNAVTP
jgi:hypothetical protein